MKRRKVKDFPYRPFTWEDLIDEVADMTGHDKTTVTSVIKRERYSLSSYFRNPGPNAYYYLGKYFKFYLTSTQIRKMIKIHIQRLRYFRKWKPDKLKKIKFHEDMINAYFKMRHMAYASHKNYFKDFSLQDFNQGKTPKQIKNPLEMKYFNFTRSNRGKQWLNA